MSGPASTAAATGTAMAASSSGGVTSATVTGSSVTEPDSLQQVRTDYRDLQSLLDSLSHKLSNVSKRVDQDFLASYRVHMLNVQSEIKKLKADVTKGEQALNSDVTVAKLETEAKWFSDECSRLRTHHMAMVKDSETMRERLRAMHHQKRFLSEQLKAIMKRNKVLQAEIDSMRGDLTMNASTSSAHSRPRSERQLPATSGDVQREEFVGSLSQDPDDLGESDDCGFNFDHAFENEDDLVRSRDAEDDIYLQTSPQQQYYEQYEEANVVPRTRSRSPQGGIRPSESEPVLRAWTPLEHSLQRPLSPAEQRLHIASEDKLLGGLVAAGRLRTDNFLPPIAASSPKKKQKDKAKPLYSRMASSAPQIDFEPKKSHKQELDYISSGKTLVELELEKSIRAIFTEVQERKRSAEQLSSSRTLTPAAKTMGSSGSAPQLLSNNLNEKLSKRSQSTDLRIIRPPQVKQMGSLSRLGVDQLQDSDKYAVMVKLLSQPQVFRTVVSKLLEETTTSV